MSNSEYLKKGKGLDSFLQNSEFPQNAAGLNSMGKLDLLHLAATSESISELLQLMDHDNFLIKLAAKRRMEEVMEHSEDVLPEIVASVNKKIHELLAEIEKKNK